jgi:hypothetical protein
MTWTSHFIDDTDGLVHFAREGYPLPRQIATRQGAYPMIAYTLCGHRVSWDGSYVNAGTYVSETTVLTCVRCIGGARDGATQRQIDKQALFGMLYGRYTDNVLRAVTAAERIVEYSPQDAEFLRRWLKKSSLTKRCARLSSTLYAKATEFLRA